MVNPCCIKFACCKGKVANAQDKKDEAEWFEPIRRKSRNQKQASADVAEDHADDETPKVFTTETDVAKKGDLRENAKLDVPKDYGDDVTIDSLTPGTDVATKGNPRGDVESIDDPQQPLAFAPQPPIATVRETLDALAPETSAAEISKLRGSFISRSTSAPRLSDLYPALSDDFHESSDKPQPPLTETLDDPAPGTDDTTSSDIQGGLGARRESAPQLSGLDKYQIPIDKQDRIKEIRARARARRAAASQSSISSEFSQGSLSGNDNGGTDNNSCASAPSSVRKKGRSRGGNSLRDSFSKMNFKKDNRKGEF